MNTKSTPSSKNLKDSLFERIEAEKVSPRSRLFFQSREFLVWFLWLLSVVVGAFAVAVSVFMVTHLQYELYEATHENFVTFMVEALPYMWIVVFGLMVYVAMYNLQHTKRGYRYPVWIILVSSIILSFAGGSALQMFGFGYTIDNVLGQQMSVYQSRDKLEQRLWQMPEEGRLVGRQVYSTVAPTSTIIFEDLDGQRWNMNVGELDSRDVDLLASGQMVRVLGQSDESGLYIFHSCGAFPSLINKDVTVADVYAERQDFIERIRRHGKQAVGKGNGPVAGTEEELVEVVPPPEESVCAGMAVVGRVAP